MSVEKIMSKAVVTVDVDARLSRIKEIFEEQGFHHLLVTEKGRLVGMISDRDVLKAISPYVGTDAETLRDKATLNKRSHQIMSRRLVTVTPPDPVLEAVKLFNRERVSCLPVVDDNQRPVGIVSWRDILRALEATTERRQSLR